MRILHVSSFYYPDQIGGAEACVQLLSETMVAAGHQVGVTCIAREAGEGEHHGVSVLRAGYSSAFFPTDWPHQTRLSRLRYKLALQFDRSLPRRMAALAARFRPDVINTHSLSELPPAVWSELGALGVPLVHTLHDYTSLCTNGAMFRDGKACGGQHLKCRLYSAPHRRHHGSVAAVVGVGSDVVANHLAAGMFTHIPPTRRRVIWNPIDLAPRERHRRRPDGEPVVFGYLGRIEASKGVDTLIAACRKLPQTGWRLLVAGRAADGLDRYVAASAGLPVEYLGFVDPDRFFDEIDCLIVPPIWPEAFGRTVAEAYSRGVPVLGSRSGGIAEQIGPENDDWLVPAGDADALAKAIDRILVDPRRLASGTRNADEVLRGTAPDAVAQAYIALYQDIASATD